MSTSTEQYLRARELFHSESSTTDDSACTRETSSAVDPMAESTTRRSPGVHEDLKVRPCSLSPCLAHDCMDAVQSSWTRPSDGGQAALQECRLRQPRPRLRAASWTREEICEFAKMVHLDCPDTAE